MKLEKIRLNNNVINGKIRIDNDAVNKSEKHLIKYENNNYYYLENKNYLPTIILSNGLWLSLLYTLTKNFVICDKKSKWRETTIELKVTRKTFTKANREKTSEEEPGQRWMNGRGADNLFLIVIVNCPFWRQDLFNCRFQENKNRYHCIVSFNHESSKRRFSFDCEVFFFFFLYLKTHARE